MMSGEFLRNAWYVAAMSDEVGRTPMSRVLLNEPVVMYRKEDGTAVALEDRCCHRRAPLSKGKVVGDDLQCGYHGFTFAASGACVAIPGQERVPASVSVRGYTLVERYGFLWIWMGEAMKADPATIPDFKENVDAGWHPTRVVLPIRAHYQLVVENLLDLSHVAFVHGETIGADDDTHATLEFDRGPDHVRLTRRAPDIATAAFYRIHGLGERSDQTKVVTFVPPCNVSVFVATTERAPDKAKPLGCSIMILHACVPETDHSMHYFISSARDFQSGPDAGAKSHQTLIKVFNEDKDIIEAQQRCIELDPQAETVNVSGDWGSVQMRRMMTDLIAAEEESDAVAAQ
jgi:phenylpropionate dioxygenase-like ring-hydroxylating dioxygenase large terminal subunit